MSSARNKRCPPQTARPPATPVMTAAAEATPPADVDVLATDSAPVRLHGRRHQVARASTTSARTRARASAACTSRSSTTAAITSPSCSPACTRNRPWRWRHGYFKVEGKPLAVMAHGTVGLQHAVDGDLQRVVRPRAGLHHPRQLQRRRDPAVAPSGTTASQDAPPMVRDYTKWDDTPWSLTHFAESAVRAYKMAVTPPMAPVVLVARRRAAGGRRFAGRAPALDPEADHAGAAAGRRGGGRGSWPGCWWPPRTRCWSPTGWRGRRPAMHAARRTGRDAAGRGHRPGRPHEFPVAPSAQPEPSARARSSPTPTSSSASRSTDFWATVNALRDQLHRSHAAADQAGREDDHASRPATSTSGPTTRTSAACRKWTWRSPPTARRRCRR